MEFEILNSTSVPRIPPSVDDHIGAESYVQYFKPDVEDCNNDNASTLTRSSTSLSLTRITEKYSAAKKEYPPPIACLVRATNQPYPPLPWPWVMKRYYTDDGRLVIKQEKAQFRREYFEAHRSDGRLVLNLVLVDGDDGDGGDGDDDDDDDDGMMFSMDSGDEMAEKEEGACGGGGVAAPAALEAAPVETV